MNQNQTPPAFARFASLRLESQTSDGLLKTVNLLASGEQKVDGMTWKTVTGWSPVPGRPGCFDCETTATLVAGETDHAVLSWTWSWPDGEWSPQTYVFMPSMVYDGNRFEHVNVPYSPFWPDASHYAVDKPVTITPQPGLRRDGKPETFELSSADAATPCIGFRTPSGRGFLIFTPATNEMGLYKYSVSEEAGGRGAHLSVSAPCVFERTPGHIGFLPGDPPRVWKTGEHVTLRLRVWMFDAPSNQILFDRFCEARKDFGGSEKPDVLPFSEAFRLISEKLDSRNWDPELGYYRHGMDRNSTRMFDFWQLGWVSGGVTTLPMLLQGTSTMQAHALKNLDFMFTQSPVPNGLWRAHHDGKVMRSDDPRPLRPGYQVSVRRLADALFFGLRQIIVLKARDEAVPAAWETSARNLADALIRVWDKRGQLGQYLDIRECDILIGGTTAAGLVPAGLVLAAQHFNNPAYLQKAEEIARKLAADAINLGYTNAGPCDALAAPDSESAYALFASLASLTVVTGKDEWKSAARDILRQLATWVTSYDFPFPDGSHCAEAEVRSSGTVWANIQNKHAAPGICTSSGDALFRYWRTTRDPLALDLLRDISHALPQLVSRPGHPVGRLSSGMMCERVNISAWEGKQAVGGNIDFSTIWVETAMLLTASEIPGVYARTDTGELFVFDHVEAAWESPQGAERVLTLHNPTDFEAVVSVLAESESDLSTPLPQELLRDARRMLVPAHGSAAVTLA